MIYTSPKIATAPPSWAQNEYPQSKADSEAESRKLIHMVLSVMILSVTWYSDGELVSYADELM